MQNRLRLDMVEATRLTRCGQLAEATALIQRALQGAGTLAGERVPAPAPPARNPATVGGAAQVASPDTGADERSASSSNRPTAAPWKPSAGPPRLALGELLHHLRRGGRAMGEGIPRQRPRRTVPVPPGARFHAASYANAAGARGYKLYVPSSYRGEPTALVVMLHGCTQDADDLAIGTRMNEHAEKRGILVLYPEQAADANPSRCWNWFRVGDQARDQGEPSLIAGMTRELMARYQVARGRVFVAGMSAGGAMAMVMAATYSDLFQAVGVHSGLAHGAATDLPSALAAMRQCAIARPSPASANVVPTIVFHGDQDTVVHPGNGDLIVERAGDAAQGPAARSAERGQVPGRRHHTRTVVRDGGGRVLVEHWLIHGAGHAWSGGSELGSYCDPSGPDASAEMLRFFLDDDQGWSS